MSLTRRLVMLFLGCTLLVWVPANYVLYKTALAEVDELWDTHLAQSARVLLAFASASAEQGELEQLSELMPGLVPAYLPRLHAGHGPLGGDAGSPRRTFAFQLHKGDGSLRLRSQNAPLEPLADAVPGFSYHVMDGIAWRVFAVADPRNELMLYVGEDHAARKDLAWHLVEHLLFPTLLAIPPLVLVVWFATSKGLRPLMRLVEQVRQRDPKDLRPLSGIAVPVEAEPLVEALNALFVRLDRVLESERQFTGNAAHELRTPLAALRVQAQVAQRETRVEQRGRALGRIIVGVDQTAHLVEQLLTLARLDAQDSLPSVVGVNLLEVARRTSATLGSLALTEAASIQVEGADDAVSLGDDTCLGILMRNLIDNAVRYAGTGGAVAVTVRRSGLLNRVIVEDTGPGISSADFEEMFRRFRRGPQTDRPGSGLGLSIVRRICDLHGGNVRLGNASRGGLRVEVQLPAVQAATSAGPIAAAEGRRRT